MSLRDPAARICRSIDGGEAAALLRSVRDHELPPEIQELLEEYESIPDARSRFIWKWIHRLAPRNTMPFVDDGHAAAVATDKTMLVLFITLLDDLVEKRGDYGTFDAITSLVRSGGIGAGSAVPNATDADVDEEYAAFAARVWGRLEERIRRGSRYDRYAPLYRFDVGQVLTAIEYSTLAIERPELATPSDLRRYETHNMGVCAFADIDLMHATVGLDGELSAFRDAVHTAQRMARIGNWLSTWERELGEGDCSSGVVVAAIERGIVDHGELSEFADGDSEVAAAVGRIEDHGLEAELLAEWNDEYRRLVEASDRIDAADLGPFVDGTEEVLRYHLASRGLK
ncbi:hypothetical protein [Halobellus ruber]|uniref:Polyprenyl synthetase n=1 Tax=Halobellus ruber TaxID=2761102 RepID=A0A7J9SLX3_9EURY|nr:hypothetical protein [Halobellus ruber]MBB6647532.1 hypothetical protein [Halobellus ruber]